MTFDEKQFLEEKRLEAERELGIPISPEDWETGSTIRPSGDVLEVMGRLADANERHLKVQLAFLIKKAIKSLELKQERVAQLTSLSQPDVSNIVRGRLQKYSVIRLLEVLLMLGGNVRWTVEVPKQASRPENPTIVGKLSLVAV